MAAVVSDGAKSAPSAEPDDEPQPHELVEIESLAAGGDGIAHLADGRVCFVRFAAPGDRAEVRILKAHRRYAHAEIVRLVEPGPDRVSPLCEVYGRCGGCAWQHIDYPAQLRAKRQLIVDALERIGRQSIDEETEMVPSPTPYGYRTRARLFATPEGVGFRRRGSHEVELIERCPILHPQLEAVLPALAAEAREWGRARTADRPAGGARRRQRRPPEIEIASGGEEGGVRVNWLGSRRRAERAEPLWLQIGEQERLRVSPGVFTQGNHALHESFVEHVRRAVLAEPAPPRGLLVELFAGIGFFTLAMARLFDRVVAVESDRRAVSDLRFNLREAALVGRVDVFERSVEDGLELEAEVGDVAGPPDVVLLDPPRTGLTPAGQQALLAMEARRIVYVSCDPATLARDVAFLSGAGYRVASVEGIDLFPQTPHVEVITRLERMR